MAREWDRIVGNEGPSSVSCPISVTEDDIAAQEADQRKWEEGVQLMEDVLDASGGAAENGWQDWVSHEDYDRMKEKLAIVREQFLDHVAENNEEREAWATVWPFQDR